MREIKFRAWDKYNKQMIPNAEMGIYEDPDGSIDFDTVLSLARFEVMQYTGLKDKNGKEIYEEDECIFYGRFGKEKGIIKFLRHGFHIVLESGAGFKIDEFYLEVIGNIYENPELLEVN